MSFVIGILFGLMIGAGAMRWYDAGEILALQELVKSLKKARVIRRVR